MFNIGLSEMLVIGVLALILIGPKQLPEVARTLGRFLNELKRSANVFTDELKSQVQLDETIAKARKRDPEPPPTHDGNSTIYSAAPSEHSVEPVTSHPTSTETVTEVPADPTEKKNS